MVTGWPFRKTFRQFSGVWASGAVLEIKGLGNLLETTPLWLSPMLLRMESPFKGRAAGSQLRAWFEPVRQPRRSLFSRPIDSPSHAQRPDPRAPHRRGIQRHSPHRRDLVEPSPGSWLGGLRGIPRSGADRRTFRLLVTPRCDRTGQQPPQPEGITATGRTRNGFRAAHVHLAATVWAISRFEGSTSNCLRCLGGVGQ
jgi:hypothetical protein